MQDSLWDKEQVAEFIGVQPGTIKIWVMKKSIPYIKPSPRVLRFDPDKIRKWLKEKSREVI
jgi:predicted site-specific integrase-resolvase